MTTIKPGLEALPIRKSSIADANKVRYRVYRNPTEFAVVEAESALMAVRVSGISAPHKIVREITGSNGTVEPQGLVRNETSISTDPTAHRPVREEMKYEFAELAEAPTEESVLFVPMGLADLRAKGMTRARILPAEMLQEIISEHMKQQSPEQVTAPAPAEEMAPEPEPMPEIQRPPELSQAEKVAQLADQVLAPAGEGQAAAASEASELSPEEVKRLLDE